jgi:mono/diheme cytochrome c family protein
MRISRWCYLTVAAAFVAALVAPATASALLTNEWNQQFAGTAVCVGCHGSSYNQTSHGLFANSGQAMTPAASSDMWPIQFYNGEEVTSNGVIALGAGTGLYEYLKFGDGANGPFGVFVGWDPAAPTIWEIDGATGVEFEDYACNQCHMIGAVKAGVKPVAVGNFAPGGAFNDTTGTANTWALATGANPATFDSYLPGAGIGCERCHGTGVAAGATGHWGSGVKIVGFNSATMKPEANAASLKILDSQVCGQCHGSFKAGGNVAGYTPDQELKSFLPNYYTLADVPGTKFFPNGENKGLKHVYYTEWALSGHSVRGAITATDTRALPYQASGASHYASAGAGRVLCNRCHTGEGYLKRKGATIMSNWTEGVDTAGNYGQECATCHISHGSVGADSNAEGAALNEPVGMAVRSPEKANGAYSTLGLAVDNKSICEDCHNWQREITNAGAAPALPATVLSSKYASHPQREIYHGRAMLEVPAGSDFMPGAKCEECHMPATKADVPNVGLTRYENRSFKRYSHRMFIMMPGDAEAWGLAPWGDSCSPCHAGESQAELQANVDTWQETAADLASEASSAIASAVAGGHNSAAGDVDLLKRAWANVDLFNQDGSGGAHNPTYEQAGLAKAIVLAKSAGGTLSISAPARVSSGALFGIAGTTLNGDGSPAADVWVKLYKNGSLYESIKSNANGSYFFALAQTSDATYSVKWSRSSQTVSDLTASAAVNMDIVKVATDLSLSISRQSAHRGVSYKLSGELHAGPGDTDVAGASIVMYYKRPGDTSWRASVTMTTGADGKFSRSTTGYFYGTYTYKVAFAGSTAYLGSSAQHKISIVR